MTRTEVVSRQPDARNSAHEQRPACSASNASTPLQHPQRRIPGKWWPRLSTMTIAAILAIHTGLLAWGAWSHSPTLNEVGHLAAGVSHWQWSRYDLYRVNPPLVRMVAALPVLCAGPATDWQHYFEGPGARPEFKVGEDFVAANGSRSPWFWTLARWSCLPFSLLGGYICLSWATQLYGRRAGAFALALWCFSPNILAHGQLITPDAAATALGVCAAYAYWRWLRRPSWTPAILAGLALGAALLTKLTWILLLGLWPLFWLTWNVRTLIGAGRFRLWLKHASQLALLLAVGLYVLNAGYSFEGTFTPLKDCDLVSRLFSPADAPQSATRSVKSYLAELPLPLPKNYLLGLDIQERDLEDFGPPSYLRGVFRDHGWWYYYLYGLLVKVPIGTHVLSLLALLVHASAPRRTTDWRDSLLLFGIPALLLLLLSLRTEMNHHLRYALPLLPFVFVWISQLGQLSPSANPRFVGTAMAALAWSVTSSLWVYPHSLSYFNEYAGGPRNGHAHLINSNIDWGQDLYYLTRWLDTHPCSHRLQLAYYGLFDPRYAAIDFQLPLTQSRIDKSLVPSDSHSPGYCAVSVTFLRGTSGYLPDGAGARTYVPPGAFAYFQRFQPVATAGYSIYIYNNQRPCLASAARRPPSCSPTTLAFSR